MATTPHSAVRRLLRLIGLAARLPVASVALAVAPSARIARDTFEITETPTSARRIVHAITAFVLGLTSWVLFAFVALTFARGALYPIFDHGPYDDAWGGPTLGGAWLVHFLLSTVFQIVVLLLVAGIGALNRRLSAPYRNSRSGVWPWVIAVLICLATALFVVAWSRQI
ncbi:hypothetical protein [Glycomyces arizonensis]|uniref:hypothetical protein n=1 Tax=Glycomyces arizonensis TaxID=256035 RepID=UPI00042632AD|nr:hypothetical protein [Glycomyces arizonensis]